MQRPYYYSDNKDFLHLAIVWHKFDNDINTPQMSSIIPGYNYDIFISYRQKDNKGDRWVSEFVEALKTELESTFKEEISVYFDINPHDGLLETHDVDASLKEKLKCLVFIPIISRTYCDPKSFAWEHEFKAFVEQASKEQFGLKVKLPNGNVASRVLPVRIHDLEAEDVKCFEEVVGGVMRTLDFVFKTASGVNRPLKAIEDHPGDNINKTYYQDQINKVALAIKEIIHGMKTEPNHQISGKTQDQTSFNGAVTKWEYSKSRGSVISGRKKLFSALVVAAVLIVVGILLYPKIFKRDRFKALQDSVEKISIAVMPFQNMTNDTLWNVWQEGIQNELINNLTNSEELKVRQMQTINVLIQSQGLINYASITPSIARNISLKLEAEVFIYGSIKEAGSILRINAQLVDSKTEEVFKSFQIDEPPEKILHIIDSISALVRNSLLISKLEKELPRGSFKFSSTNSPEAYIYYINGRNAADKEDPAAAVKMLSQALEIDSNFIDAAVGLSYSYFNQNLFEEGKKVCLKYYGKRDKMPFQLKILMNFVYSIYFETPYESIACSRQLQNIDDQVPSNYYNIGTFYVEMHQFDKAIPEFEKGLELYNKWRSKPSWSYEYILPGIAYHKTGQYKKEKKLYKKAEQDFPDSPSLIYNLAILKLTEGDTAAANNYIDKYKSIRKNNSSTDAEITAELASLYLEADILDKAEEYYRKAESMKSNNSEGLNYTQPNNPFRLNNLAWFLIDKDRNINEGVKLVDRALKLQPDNYMYLDCKGWGLFKQGKYTEAQDLLDKAWQLKPIYNHDIYLHLEAAKKAVANQKNN
jgi:TolB-like protein/Tfp pilus assembly protein PilF